MAPDLKSIPGGVDWVVTGTRPETSAATVQECADLGIERVWMHRGPGGALRLSVREVPESAGVL
jgi:predicted CoA-binding protein